MSKNIKRYFIVIAILAIMYTVLVFAIPYTKKEMSTFIIAYIAAMVAFLAQIYVGYVAIAKADNIKSKFYGIPILRVGYLYLIAQLIASTAIIVINVFIKVPVWVIIIVLVLLLGISLIGFIGTVAVKEEVEKIDNATKVETRFIGILQIESSSLANKVKNEELKNEIQKFSDKVRFSDPVSSKELVEIEDEIDKKYVELKDFALNNNIDDAKKILVDLNNLLDERNKLCKLYK